LGRAREGQIRPHQGRACHNQYAASKALKPLKLIEIHREDIGGLPRVMALLRGQPWRFVVFCDDLSFDAADVSYKSLKAALEGGIEASAKCFILCNVNRRHILSRDDRKARHRDHPTMPCRKRSARTAGLWLGFHSLSQDDYLAMVFTMRNILACSRARKIEREALEWSYAGLAFGRTPQQYIRPRDDWAGRG
jgi:predicted AAA+ superfamily ATPase